MKKTTTWATALTFASLLGGCTVTHYDNRPPPPPPAPAPPPPPPGPAQPPAPPPPPAPGQPPPPPAADMTGWQRLGERWVNSGVDRDTFLINNRGQYRELKVKVEQSSLEMYDMIVTFDDGSTYAPKVRQTFGKDAVSRNIDLPGSARRIKKVEFQYRNLEGNRRAQVELWGR
ncbi:MAG TPA: hypothetical protein VFS43_33275 [Polyangiaceae bacterium]|nr:hypothetical protein [Polyangiaceae bacterium]